MSFDPSDEYSPDRPPPRSDYGPDQPPLSDVSNVQAARNRVQVPAILLIVVGALNILLALWLIWQGFVGSRMSPADFEREMKRQNPQQMEQMKQLGWTTEGLLKGVTYGFSGTGAAGLLAAIVTILGGVRMLQLKSYGLAVFGSILAAIPCISCTGCCGVGEAIGIWAIVVLLNPDVRAAFQ